MPASEENETARDAGADNSAARTRQAEDLSLSDMGDSRAARDSFDQIRSASRSFEEEGLLPKCSISDSDSNGSCNDDAKKSSSSSPEGPASEKYADGSRWTNRLNPDGSLTVGQERAGAIDESTYDPDGKLIFEKQQRSSESGREIRTLNHLTGNSVYERQSSGANSTTAFDSSGKAIYHRDDFLDGSYQSMELKNDNSIELVYGNESGSRQTTIDAAGVETSQLGPDGKINYNARENFDGSAYQQQLLPNGRIRVSYKDSSDAKAVLSEIDPAPKGSVEAGLVAASNLEGRQIWAKNEWTKKISYNGDWGCAISVSEPLLNAGLIKNPQSSVGGLVKELERSGYKRLPPGSQAQSGDVGIGHYSNDSNPFRGGYAHVFMVMGKNSAGKMEVMDNTNRPQGGQGPKKFQKEPLESIPYPEKIYYRKNN